MRTAVEAASLWAAEKSPLDTGTIGIHSCPESELIFKEKGVYFSSDFRDLGYIEYEKGSLDAKAMNLLMERSRQCGAGMLCFRGLRLGSHFADSFLVLPAARDVGPGP